MLIETDDYIDANTAAQMLGVTEARIRALCKSGRFPGTIYIGQKNKTKLIPRIEVENHTKLRPGVKKQLNESFIANIMEQAQKNKN